MIQMPMLRKLYQNCGAVSAIWTILGKVLAGVLVASACVPQNKSESILQTSSLLPSETKVDSVDLAFLWPLPSSESKIRDMISAEDVLSSELFLKSFSVRLKFVIFKLFMEAKSFHYLKAALNIAESVLSGALAMILLLRVSCFLQITAT